LVCRDAPQDYRSPKSLNTHLRGKVTAMSGRGKRSLGGLAVATVALLFVPRAANAERNALASAGAAIDPWSSRGGSEFAVASSTFTHKDTIDPWKAPHPSGAWISVRSGLDSGATWMSVRSGLEPSARYAVCPPPATWVHSDIVDPWADSR
jgi:hypothetical protein